MTRGLCGLIVMITLVIMAGCAAVGPEGGSGPVSSGPLPPPETGTRPGEGVNRLDPEPADDLGPLGWNEAVPVPDAPQVLVRGVLTGGPPCQVIGRVEVNETPKAVTITVWVGRARGVSCADPQPDVGFPYETEIALETPVGTRQVIDGGR